jgi:hypothetical protein
MNLAQRALAVASGCAALAGCNDVSRFSTAADESYCGSIVTGPFVRQGFGPGIRMRLNFDADRLSEKPGEVSTDDGLLDHAMLRPIPQLANDPLSSLQFGEGRVRNLLLGVSPSQGPSAFAIVSLMENGNIEMRVMRGAPLPSGVTAYPVESGTQLFGVFPLARQKGQCGF